jgi:hypothetical protein
MGKDIRRSRTVREEKGKKRGGRVLKKNNT